MLRKKRRTSYTGDDYASAISVIDQRLDNVLQTIFDKIPLAGASVESDTARSNREKAILGLANLLGSKMIDRRKISFPSALLNKIGHGVSYLQVRTYKTRNQHFSEPSFVLESENDLV